jgi:hypothetical protein
MNTWLDTMARDTEHTGMASSKHTRLDTVYRFLPSREPYFSTSRGCSSHSTLDSLAKVSNQYYIYHRVRSMIASTFEFLPSPSGFSYLLGVLAISLVVDWLHQ